MSGSFVLPRRVTVLRTGLLASVTGPWSKGGQLPALTYQTSVMSDDERLRVEVLSIPASTVSTVSSGSSDIEGWVEQMLGDLHWSIVARASFAEHEAPGGWPHGSLMEAVVASVAVHAHRLGFCPCWRGR